MRLKRILYLGLDPTNYTHNGELIHCSIIQTIPRPMTDSKVQASLSLFDRYTHLIISSKTAIPILLDYLPKAGIPLKLWADKTTIAVGQATQLNLQRCGLTNIVTAENETAEGIIDVIRNTVPPNAYLFWPHSSGSRPVIKEFLNSQQIMHEDCSLYDTVPRLPTALPNLTDFDEIIFTSPSTVDAFIKIFGTLPANINLIPIGPVTEDYLKQQKSLSGKEELS